MPALCVGRQKDTVQTRHSPLRLERILNLPVAILKQVEEEYDDEDYNVYEQNTVGGGYLIRWFQ